MKQKNLSPQVQAEIAIKALKIASFKAIAKEYETSECTVYLLKKILIDNAADLFLLLSGDETLLKMLETIRDQIDSIEQSLDKISTLLAMNQSSREEDYGLYDI
jgi:hypothetical protein